MNTGARAANSRPIPVRFLGLLDFSPRWYVALHGAKNGRCIRSGDQPHADRSTIQFWAGRLGDLIVRSIRRI